MWLNFLEYACDYIDKGLPVDVIYLGLPVDVIYLDFRKAFNIVPIKD